MAAAGEGIYLDHAATSPLRPEALDAMLPFLRDSFGNASSPHRWGRTAKATLDAAREQVAALIAADPEEIVFTSGGTEANNFVLRSITELHPGARVLVSAVEHPSVLRTALHLAKRGAIQLEIIPVDTEGRAQLCWLADALAQPTALVSVMAANNETGVLQPIEAIAGMCQARGVPFHCDATQSAWITPMDSHALGAVFVTISAHKLGGPQGVGALYVRREQELAVQATGGSQERRRRAGTENVAAIVGYGIACDCALHERDGKAQQLQTLRDQLEYSLLTALPSLRVNGKGASRLPHILNVSLPGIEGERAVRALDAAGIAASTGAACSSGQPDPSPTLRAMGRTHAEALEGIRFSLGWCSKPDSLPSALERIVSALESLRA
jgi:cysteine desulfurase